MKYNNEILNKIVETYNTKYHNDLGLENIANGYLEMMKNGSKIHIKKKNRGTIKVCRGESTRLHVGWKSMVGQGGTVMLWTKTDRRSICKGNEIQSIYQRKRVYSCCTYKIPEYFN